MCRIAYTLPNCSGTFFSNFKTVAEGVDEIIRIRDGGGMAVRVE